MRLVPIQPTIKFAVLNQLNQLTKQLKSWGPYYVDKFKFHSSVRNGVNPFQRPTPTATSGPHIRSSTGIEIKRWCGALFWSLFSFAVLLAYAAYTEYLTISNYIMYN